MTPEEFLAQHNITYTRHEHPAVYTCAEAEEHCANIPGIPGKNLLLKSKKGERFFLLILPAKKQTDLKKFAGIVDEKKITFASPNDLNRLLGLEPGAVSPFGLLNDVEKKIEVYIDNDIYNADIVSFHPNVNTATLELDQKAFHEFTQALEHNINVITLEGVI